jgi:hypothetical protein
MANQLISVVGGTGLQGGGVVDALLAEGKSRVRERRPELRAHHRPRRPQHAVRQPQADEADVSECQQRGGGSGVHLGRCGRIGRGASRKR